MFKKITASLLTSVAAGLVLKLILASKMKKN